jgi:hypothetical protein
MKKLLLGFFILSAAIACKPSAERDDDKFLGTWKGYVLLDNGTYNYVKIELSGDSEFPYRVTTFNYSGTSKKNYELDVNLCKIYDGYLIADENTKSNLMFKINSNEGKFVCSSRKYPLSGPLTNHIK